MVRHTGARCRCFPGRGGLFSNAWAQKNPYGDGSHRLLSKEHQAASLRLVIGDHKSVKLYVARRSGLKRAFKTDMAAWRYVTSGLRLFLRLEKSGDFALTLDLKTSSALLRFGDESRYVQVPSVPRLRIRLAVGCRGNGVALHFVFAVINGCGSATVAAVWWFLNVWFHAKGA